MGSWGGGTRMVRAHVRRGTSLRAECSCAVNSLTLLGHSAGAHRTSPLPSDPNSQSLWPPPVLRPSEHTERLEPKLPCGLTIGRGHAAWRQNLHVQILALPLATCVMLTSSLTPFKPLFPCGQKKENNSFPILGLS